MKYEPKTVLTILVYWYVLSFLSGWLANDSEPIEIIGLVILDAIGFLASVVTLRAESLKAEEVRK